MLCVVHILSEMCRAVWGTDGSGIRLNLVKIHFGSMLI